MSGDAWRRWMAAEHESRHGSPGSPGSDDEADAALRAVFAAVPSRHAREGFSSRVAIAVAREARRRARLARAVLTTAGVSFLALSIVLLTQVPRLFRPMLDVGVGGLVWTVAAVDRGISVWGVLARFARTTGALVVAPQVTLVLMGLALVAIAALYGLNRVLELEERSSS